MDFAEIVNYCYLSIFAVNVGYQKSCFQEFRAPPWKRTHSQEMLSSERNYIDNVVDIIEYSVVLRREKYILKQLRKR